MPRPPRRLRTFESNLPELSSLCPRLLCSRVQREATGVCLRLSVIMLVACVAGALAAAIAFMLAPKNFGLSRRSRAAGLGR
jgi:hypothetical protein